MQKILATLTVLTRNSGKTLEKALESAKDFDDIVICDGGSTDNTLEIAKGFGARVIQQNVVFLENGKIFDYAGVRNQTYAAAKHNWIFWLDSDEYASEAQIAKIRNIISERGENGEGAFWVNRKYVIHDTPIDCAATYPNRQMRFFAKRSTEGFVKRIHERIKLKLGVQPEFINEVTYIPFEPDIPTIRRKWDYQIAVAAAQASPLSLWNFFMGLFDTAKVSLLWFLRLVYNTLFCSGTKMPFKFEMERHRFHLKLLAALWNEVYVRKKRIGDWFSLVEACLFAPGLLITVVAATYRLSEAPAIWYDEGYLTQVAMNVAEHGAQLMQVAPGQFISSGTVSSGFTLYYPVALFYKLFGVGVLQGRAMMAIYIIAFWLVSYLFIRSVLGGRIAGVSALLIATLPLVYGNGKSVLGEVPGLFYLVCTLFTLHHLSKTNYRSMAAYALAGLFAGLCLVTKPLFILILPAVLLTYFFRIRRIHITVPGFFVGLVGLMLPVLLWLHIQFGPSDTWLFILNYYVDPYGTNGVQTGLKQGLLRFVTDETSLYTLLLCILWAFSLFIRFGRRRVCDAELLAFIFSWLIVVASVRLPSYNRYIFPSTVLALLFIPNTLQYSFDYFRERWAFINRTHWAPGAPAALMAILFILQSYQLCFTSFVASYYHSNRTGDLEAAFSRLDRHASFFIYNTPAMVILLPNRNYYQFIMPHPNGQSMGTDLVGLEELPLLAKGVVDYVIVPAATYKEHPEIFPNYTEFESAAGVAILSKT
jgi:glycosyltransferase involved in cell wall biosynthesis